MAATDTPSQVHPSDCNYDNRNKQTVNTGHGNDGEDTCIRRENGTSHLQAVAYIIKGNVGTGVLAIPQALSKAGTAVGPVGMLIIAIICTHCMNVLVNTTQYLCKRVGRPSLSYSDMAEESFRVNSTRLARHSKTVRHVVSAFQHVTQFGFCCVYILFVAQNIQFVVMKLTGNAGDGCHFNEPMALQIYELCVLALLIPYCWIRNVKYIAFFSIVANIASLAGFLLILYVIFFVDGLGDITRLPTFSSWDSLPLYLGTALYAFQGATYVLPMENKMKEPHTLTGLFGPLNVAMVLVFVLYVCVGFYGYIEYGDKAAGSITLNIPGWYGVIAQLLFALAIFISYGMQFYVPMDIIGDALESTRLSKAVGKTISDYGLRSMLVIITFGVAAVADRYLGLLISLVGSLSSSALSLIFPPLLEVAALWPDRRHVRHFHFILAKDLMIVFLGIFALVTGTAVSIQQLINSIAKQGSGSDCPSPL